MFECWFVSPRFLTWPYKKDTVHKLLRPSGPDHEQAVEPHLVSMKYMVTAK